MALKIPNTLSNLIFSDSQSASLVQQSLTNSVQPLLNFVNQYFTTSGSGNSILLTLNQALTLTKQLLLATGSMQTPSMAFGQNNTLGVFYDQANLRMGVVINNTLVGFVSAAGFNLQSPSAAGNAVTFYNASGVALGNVNNAGLMTLPSFSATATPGFISASGFKHTIPLGHVYVNSTTAGQSQQCVDTIVLVSGSGATARYSTATMPFAGSVVSIVCDCNATIACAQTIQLYKNGNAMTNITASVGANNTFGLASFTKGASGANNAFVSTDRIYATVTYATAVTSTTTATFVKMYVEMAA